MVRALVPFYLGMIAVLMIVTYVPWFSLFLPRVFG